jgi:AraC-like DNA-binding protein
VNNGIAIDCAFELTSSLTGRIVANMGQSTRLREVPASMKIAEKLPTVTDNPDALQRSEPLVQLLRALRVTGVLVSSVEIGAAPWAASIPHEDDTIILYMVSRGRCVGGTFEPRELVDLVEHDVLLLPRPGRCLMAQSRTVVPVPLEDLLQRELGAIDALEDKWLSLFSTPFVLAQKGGEEPEVRITAIRMFFDRKLPPALLEGLPAVIHLAGFSAKHREFVDAVLGQIIAEGESGLAGQSTASRLAEALVVKCFDVYLRTFAGHRPGFLRGLKDPYIAKVMGAIQSDPTKAWTPVTMARAASLSRSAFAERFRATMAMTPARFVTTIRMARAAEMLQHGSASIARIAEMAGYGSEAAFSRAFRKWSGSPPGALRRGAWTTDH